jgi:hypothetical protein
MLSRNLPLYSTPSDEAVWSHRAQSGPPAPGHLGSIRPPRRQLRGAGLFWLLVVAVALGAGMLTWLVLPVRAGHAQQAAPSSEVLVAPQHPRRQLPASGLTTARLGTGRLETRAMIA